MARIKRDLDALSYIAYKNTVAKTICVPLQVSKRESVTIFFGSIVFMQQLLLVLIFKPTADGNFVEYLWSYTYSLMTTRYTHRQGAGPPQCYIKWRSDQNWFTEKLTVASTIAFINEE